MPNLYGDILSDMCAGLIGGLSLTPSGNIGNWYSGLSKAGFKWMRIFEIIGKKVSRPSHWQRLCRNLPTGADAVVTILVWVRVQQRAAVEAKMQVGVLETPFWPSRRVIYDQLGYFWRTGE
ncbi:hypothetical protein F4778DRAFT_737505 [Xylariomycetidae sp. FL2044]|nr:hypothetical protein F4778DRAFT_737505 [Xylariomycetidae sp. FL2044]